MSKQVFLLPDLGEGLTEADITEWKIRVGDTVSIDEVVVEVETAKASVEVPIPFAGRVTELHGEVGATLAVGTPLISIDDGGPNDDVASRVFDAHREEEQAGSGNVLVGYGTSNEPRRRRRRVPGLHTLSPAQPSPEAGVTAGSGAPVRVISPIVRQLAGRTGVELTSLTGSGLGGVITRADVELAAKAVAIPAAPRRDGELAERIPIKGSRKAIADKLSKSRREIPDATTWVDVDASALLEARGAINDLTPADQKVSLLALVARLALAALSQFPELNSMVDTERNEIVRYGQVNLGVAAQTPRGLAVPVIRGASAMSTVELSAALRETVSLAREGKLSPDRLSGGTFTLNNYGVFGVDGSTAIINHPEAAILGVGRVVDKPWVHQGQLAVRKVTQLSLSFDHRVCDGGTAGGFLRLFGDYIESPVGVLGRI
jgi:2-oxoisovalerate dehydrogenase E2 component (dihydrolipoyl transacylase)